VKKKKDFPKIIQIFSCRGGIGWVRKTGERRRELDGVFFFFLGYDFGISF
jgi:hypothetical protein